MERWTIDVAIEGSVRHGNRARWCAFPPDKPGRRIVPIPVQEMPGDPAFVSFIWTQGSRTVRSRALDIFVDTTTDELVRLDTVATYALSDDEFVDRYVPARPTFALVLNADDIDAGAADDDQAGKGTG